MLVEMTLQPVLVLVGQDPQCSDQLGVCFAHRCHCHSRLRLLTNTALLVVPTSTTNRHEHNTQQTVWVIIIHSISLIQLNLNNHTLSTCSLG